MKYKKKQILGILLSAILILNLLTGCTSAVQKKKEGVFTILTSFYPMYIIALNITDGAENVEIRNLANPSTGCLHDYQMKPTDMVNMEQNDVMIINGAGMEEFLEDAQKGIENLHIIDATKGLPLLASEEVHDHDHDHGEEEDVHEEEHSHAHGHGEYNAHAWLSTDLYQQQVMLVAEELAKANPENATLYKENAEKYIEKIRSLSELIKEMRPLTEGKKIVVFHEAFAYLAKELGMEVIESLEVESDAGLSAGQIRHLIDEVKDSGADLLLSEKQYSGNIGHTIENETGIKDITLDSCVSGKMEKDSYLKAMEDNLRILKEALSNESQLRIPLH